MKPRMRLIISVFILFTVELSAMQNGSSFVDAKRSGVNYSKTIHSAGDISCSAISAFDKADNTTVSTKLIQATQTEPEYCLVHGVISVEVQYLLYLPSDWNGRLFMQGNWGDAGESLYDPIAHHLRMKAVKLGFAVAFTNTGHDAASEPGSTWAYKQFNKEVDYGFRAVHVTNKTVRSIIQHYYGSKVEYAYFDGCSTGGRQGLMSAQRFPADFDGILVGAPVMDLTNMLWQYWRNQMAIDKTPLTPEKLVLLGKTLTDLYDGVDGIKDGVITDPLAINFQPQRDLPRKTKTQKGFSADEIEMLTAIYSPVRINDREIFPRTVIGGEMPGLAYTSGTYEPEVPMSAWETRVVPDRDGLIDHRFIVDGWFKYVLFDVDDPNRDWRTIDPKIYMSKMNNAKTVLDAVDPDLSAFHKRGGKLILYHGWADFGVNPLRSLQYYENVNEVSNGKAMDFFQLYLVPGMQHCWGGTDVDRFDLMTPLINWVEKGSTPGNIIGKRMENSKVTRTKPLCPWPTKLVYKGRGDINSQDNFSCR